MLISSLLALNACQAKGGKNAEDPVSTGFECDVSLTYRDMDVKGHLTRLTAGTLVMDITEPKTLEGMSMKWDGQTISVNMYGLSFGVDPEAIPETALGKSILDALDSVPADGDRTVTDEGVLTKGTAAGGEFTFISDAETGNLLSLTIPSVNLTATFSNFQVK